MRRRLGRGRRRGGAADSRRTPIDAELWLTRIAEAGLAGTASLDPLVSDGVPPDYAVLGSGRGETGGEVLVAFSPNDGGDAALAILACAQQRAASAQFGGDAVAVAPRWSRAARRRLGLIGALPFRFRAVSATPGEAGGAVEPEDLGTAAPVEPQQIARLFERPQDEGIFVRALAAFEGLAAKHGGGVRGVGDRVELVLMARRVAVLEAADGGVRLETLLPSRGAQELTSEGLATALDRLEGSIRKRLNDKRIRAGEEGLREALLPILDRAAEVRRACHWPQPGSDPEPLDLAGLDGEGRLVVAAAREALGLPALGDILDAALDVAPALGVRLGLPVRSGRPRLLLAAREFEEAALAALSALELTHEEFAVRPRRSGDLFLERCEPWVGAAAAPIEARVAARPALREAPEASEVSPADAAAAGAAKADVEVAQAEAEAEKAEAGTEPAEAEGGRFEEISLFDLDDEESAPADAGARRRRRGRRRGRRGRGPREGEGEGGEAAAAEAPVVERERTAAPRAEEEPSGVAGGETPEPEVDEDALVDDEEETLAPLVGDVPEIEEEAPEPAYEDDEEEPDDADLEADLAQRERELRRRARFAKVSPAPIEPEPPRPPRRRSAFVALAERGSILTALLLARDVRLVEGFWVYPQRELMTFFRSIATDLREETPIYLVGFAASPPARDTIQAAALYRGRLDWFDHHPWPPEDLLALRDAIGEEHVHVVSGAESSLAAVLARRSRRSRFSDKLVELATGRFTQHDYERWGRLWWHRLGELAERPGERRAEIDPLLVGRPSDLTREASSAPVPPLPPEVAHVSGRDYRLVHFGGYIMVVVDVPPELDLHLVARIARERYEAHISLAHRPDEELVVLGGDESRVRRGLDLAGMAAHLVSKHEWIETMSDDDHVARMRVRDLWREPGRLDEVIADIAMGRSIVEG